MHELASFRSRSHLRADPQETVTAVGHFYTNITLKGAGQNEVTRVMGEEPRWAIISPNYGDIVVVFDHLSERQDGAVYDLAQSLSRKLHCLAFAVMNHDDDVLYFRLFDRGRLLDEYNSSPSYFADAPSTPSGGNAALLCNVFGVRGKEGRLEEVLRYDQVADPGPGRSQWEIDRHADICKELNLPEITVGGGYRYIAEDEIPEGLAIDQCVVLEGTEE